MTPEELFSAALGFSQQWRVAQCRTDGVHQVEVPWAREGSGFTLLLEALVMLLSAEMPVEGIADLLGETDTRLWRVLIYFLLEAQAKSGRGKIRRLSACAD